MPDFGAPVVNNSINPAQGFNTLNSIMNFQQNQQALQMNALKIQEQQSATQQAQQQMNERQLLQTSMQSGKDPDGNSLKDANGEVIPTALNAFASKYMPLTGQAVSQSIIQTLDNKNKLNDSTRTLGQNFKNDMSGIVRSFIGTNADPQTINSALDQYAQQNPAASNSIQYAQSLVNNLGNHLNPSQRDQALLHLSQAFQPSTTTEQEQAPKYGEITTPSGAKQYTQYNQYAPGGVTQVGAPIAQGANPQYWEDSNHVLHPVSGGFQGVGGGGQTQPTQQTQAPQQMPAGTPQGGMQGNIQGAQGQQLNANQNPSYIGGPQVATGLGITGQKGIVEQNANTVNLNRKLATDALTNYDVLQKVKDAAIQPGMYLGPGSQYVGNIATTLSNIPGFEGAKNYANNYNELVKYVAQNAARMGSQMGLTGSDARLDLALHGQPNQNMDSRTIVNVAQYLQGLVKMGAAKANAMDSWLKQSGNSIQNEHEFENVWRNAADPRLFQLNEMTDPNEAANYAKLHIKKSELPALNQKHQVLESLGAFNTPATLGGPQ